MEIHSKEKNNKLDEKIYSYDLKIKIYNPTRINHVDLMIDKEKYTFDIGNFSCLSKDQVLNEQNTHLTCNIEKSDSLHKINLENMTDRPIIVTDISIINTLKNNVKVCRNLDTSMIKAIQKECMAYTYFNKENTLKIFPQFTYTVRNSFHFDNMRSNKTRCCLFYLSQGKQCCEFLGC